MICFNLDFNPENDVHEVDQFGFVDIHDALVNGTIPANLQAQEANFNKIEDPSMIRARPDDTFASMRAEKAYGAYVRHEREKSAKSNDTEA